MGVDRYIAGANPLLNPNDVVEWSTGKTLACGFSTREDAEAAAKLASVTYRQGLDDAQAKVRRALGIESDD